MRQRRRYINKKRVTNSIATNIDFYDRPSFKKWYFCVFHRERTKGRKDAFTSTRIVFEIMASIGRKVLRKVILEGWICELPLCFGSVLLLEQDSYFRKDPMKSYQSSMATGIPTIEYVPRFEQFFKSYKLLWTNGTTILTSCYMPVFMEIRYDLMRELRGMLSDGLYATFKRNRHDYLKKLSLYKYCRFFMDRPINKNYAEGRKVNFAKGDHYL